VSLVIVGILLPIGIGYISTMGDTMVTLVNTTANASPSTYQVPLSSIADPAVITITTIILPIIVAIGIALAYLKRSGI